jgi:hypothetical protein
MCVAAQQIGSHFEHKVRHAALVRPPQDQRGRQFLTSHSDVFKASAKAMHLPQPAKATLRSWPSSWPWSASSLRAMATAKRLLPL